MAGIFTTPRPAPDRRAPLLAAASVLVLALPVFVLVGWPIAGWALAVVLWIASGLLGLVLGRLRLGMDTLAPSGVLAFGMMFRAIAVMVVLIAVTVSNTALGLSAAALYALAYTCELGLSLVSYFGTPAQ
jgi:hypothetical protein